MNQLQERADYLGREPVLRPIRMPPQEISTLVGTIATIEWPRGHTVTRVKPNELMTLYAIDVGWLTFNVDFTITNNATDNVYGTYRASSNVNLTARYDDVQAPSVEGFYTLTAQPDHGAVGSSVFEVTAKAVDTSGKTDWKTIMIYAGVGVGVLAGVYLVVSLIGRKK